MSEDIGWKTDKVSRYRYSITICQELPWCWHSNWKRWFSNDHGSGPQKKRLVLSGCTAFFIGWTWCFGGNAGDADFSLWLQPPWWNSVAPNSFCDTAVSPLSLVRCVCWGAVYGKGDILGGFLSCSCLSRNMTLWGICSFSVPHNCSV